MVSVISMSPRNLRVYKCIVPQNKDRNQLDYIKELHMRY